jgi:hypothetical protein
LTKQLFFFVLYDNNQLIKQRNKPIPKAKTTNTSRDGQTDNFNNNFRRLHI